MMLAVALIVMLVFLRGQKRSNEAAIKYLVLSGAASAMARRISLGRSMCFNSTAETLMPHGSVWASMIDCSSSFESR